MKNVQDFNGADGNKAGADDIANIIPYTFIKSILTMPDTNLKYLQLFVNSGEVFGQPGDFFLVGSRGTPHCTLTTEQPTEEGYAGSAAMI